MRLGFTLVSLVLIAVLSSGNLLHALIPHEHAHDTGAITLLHTALRHEEQSVALLPVIAFLFVAFVSLVAPSVIARAFALHALASRSNSRGLYALSRGIFAYRRFV